MLTASHWPLLTWVYIMLTGWLHARRGTNKIKIKIKIRICTYVYFSLDLLALGALTPALILTLQVVLWSITRDYTRSNPAHAQQNFFSVVVLVVLIIIWRCLHKVRSRDGTDCLPGWHFFVLRAGEMLIATFYYTINCLSTGKEPDPEKKKIKTLRVQDRN